MCFVAMYIHFKNILILEKLEKYFSPCLLSSVYTCDFVEQDFKQVFAKYFAALKGKVTNYEPLIISYSLNWMNLYC